MAEERGELCGERLRPEGGEVVVEVAAIGDEDGGGESLRERPGLKPVGGGQRGEGGEEGEDGEDGLNALTGEYDGV